MRQSFTAWVMRDEDLPDEHRYLAFCEEVPGAGGHGQSRQEALDDLAVNIEQWLDSYRDQVRAYLMPGAEMTSVAVSRNEVSRPCHVVQVTPPDVVAEMRTPRGAFTAIIESADDWLIARCAEVPGANGQGRTREEVLDNLASSIELMLLDRRADDLGSVGPDAEVAMVLLK